MTFIAFLKINPEKVIGIADGRLITEPEGRIGHAKKLYLIGSAPPKAVLMEAGDADITYNIRYEILKGNFEEGKKKKKLNFIKLLSDIQSIYHNTYIEYCDSILKKYNLTWKEFQTGKLSPQIMAMVEKKIDDFAENFDPEFAVSFYDFENEEVSIYSIGSEPLALPQSHEFYYIGGVGADYADKQFENLVSPEEKMINMSYAEGIYTILKIVEGVKEKNVNVGGKVNIATTDSSGARELDNDVIEKFIEVIKKEKESKDDAIKVIEEILKEYKLIE